MRLAEQYLDRFAALLERLFFDGAPAASATGKITASANSQGVLAIMSIRPVKHIIESKLTIVPRPCLFLG